VKKFTELHLPIRMQSKWMMLIADPRKKTTWRIAFDEWEWDNPATENILEQVAKGLKDVFMMLRLRLVNDDWDGERDTAMWPFPRNNKDQSKIHTTRFFKTTQNIEGVTPLDRMIALWSQLVPGILPSAGTINAMIKRHRKDEEVLERLQIIQAMFLTESLGYPIVTTGHHMVNINKNTVVVAGVPNNIVNQEHLVKEAN
jgi:hypothetical protein